MYVNSIVIELSIVWSLVLLVLVLVSVHRATERIYESLSGSSIRDDETGDGEKALADTYDSVSILVVVSTVCLHEYIDANVVSLSGYQTVVLVVGLVFAIHGAIERTYRLAVR
ncbi:hypothetical protein A6E15_13095 [Natrinema saccharevitans]|uniref:Uncharacterized protein n=1 Tax=Natrinema saccharevitans TaxID=301967 RepID=A0A1S8B1A5_9EURY|nr:hypothetical protein A6E15_13095 [Natrinema saccharevitans]